MAAAISLSTGEDAHIGYNSEGNDSSSLVFDTEIGDEGLIEKVRRVVLH